MELNALTIYLLSIADSIREPALVIVALFTVIGVLGSCIAIPYAITNGLDRLIRCSKLLKIPSIIFSIMLLIVLLVPSQKTLIAMMVVPPVVKNEAVKELPTNVVEFINIWLKENSKKD